jgi:hypothetical protein
MTPCRTALLLLFVAGSPALAQPVPLAEAAKPGDCSKYTIDLYLTGNLLLTQEGGRQPIKLEARARHVFADRTLAVDAGMPHRSARFYDVAGAAAIVGGERFDRTLALDRRLVGAHRNPDGLLCYAPAGPLSRDELDLVTEHFNPHCLPGLLPGKDVNPNDTWPLGNPAAQAACQVDGLIKNGLTGKLTEVKDGVATFTIEGTVEGIEAGGKVTLNVTATGRFEITSRRITELTWKQKDDREQGPVSPASQVEATIALKREALAAVPKELDDAAITAVPRGDVPPGMLNLRHTDSKGRYVLIYPRDWQVTGQSDTHLILRLLDRGEFVAQATVSVWKSLPPGRHVPADEFKKAVSVAPGWVLGRVTEEGEVPVGGGRWLYRVSAEGTMDNLPVVQTFHLLAGPNGDQIVVTVAMKPDKVKVVGNRDVSLVNAIEFRK